MDLLAISRTVWRHKWATIPVLVIVIVGMAYVLVVKKPIYQAQSSYILLPAAPVTAAQLSHSPSVKGANPNNPFTSYGDLSVVVDLLTEVMSSPAQGHVLKNEGVTGPYTVAPLATAYGNAPIIQITAEGPSPTAATTSAALVGKAVQTQLADIQASQGTSRRYWIGSLELSRPDEAQQQISSRLRDLIAVIAVGLILIFVVVSTMNAREERKRDRLGPEILSRREENGWPVAVAEPERTRGLDAINAERDQDYQVVGLEDGRQQSRPWSFESELKEARMPSDQKIDA